ncbi:MAG: DHA2 family multidrug resistance protein [Patiriisocius sp.]|jgi:DHA2 family multidrug resistance protein
MANAGTLSRVPEGIEASPPILAMFELYGPNYVWFAVITSMLGSFATLLTGTIINVAIPEVMGAFGIGQDQAQWLSTGFLAAGTVTMLTTAWCTKAFGARATYIAAMLVFLAGSILGGLSPNPETLIFSRIVTGAAAGILGPLAMVINFQIFPARHRGFAMGLFGIGVVLAPALGPTLGGLLIDNYNWRYVFFLAIPFSMISVPLALMFMPSKQQGVAIPAFDWIGCVLISVFLVSLLTALTDGQSEGWKSDYIILLFSASFVSLVGFCNWEMNTPHPMLDIRIFMNPRFFAASVVTFVVGIGLYGSTYLLPLFLQTLQGIMPTDSGLLMLPAGLAMAAFFPIAGALSDRVQPRYVIMAGLILFVISSWLMRVVDINTPYTMILVWALIGRIGLALIFPSLNAASLASLPLDLLSQGSGAVNFLRQLGGAFGVNLLSIHLAQRTSEFSQQFTSTQISAPATLDLLVNVQDLVFRDHFGFVMEFPASFGFLSSVIYTQALTLAYREGFILIAVVFLFSIIPTYFMHVERK